MADSSLTGSTAPSRGHDIVVIGASAGGMDALLALIGQLPRDLRAAVFVTVHLMPGARGMLAEVLSRAGTLRVKPAEDGEAIRNGVAYIAQPDRHLIVQHGNIRLTRGPRENRWRPA